MIASIEDEDLVTEQRNPESTDIDCRSTEEILEIVNAEDQRVPAPVRSRRSPGRWMRP